MALAVEPSFVMYRVSATLAGMLFVGVPLRADFSLDEKALLDAIAAHRPALTWLAYPNNPTGNLFPREAILRAVTASPGLVVARGAEGAADPALLRERTLIAGSPAAYVCRQFTCQAPTAPSYGSQNRSRIQLKNRSASVARVRKRATTNYGWSLQDGCF